MRIAYAIQVGGKALRQAGIDSHHLDTLLLLEEVTGKSRSWLIAHGEEHIEPDAAKQFNQLLRRRYHREPIVHLTNRSEFYGLDLYVNSHVLSPRMETEIMVDYAIQYAPKNSRLIDVGTGSGAIAIAIKKHRPDLGVWATDVSSAALAVATRNAKNLNVSIQTMESNLWDHVDGSYATVVTNLPYLRDDAELMPEVAKEPGVALFGGKDGLELYRRFLRQLPNHLEQDGYLFSECDPWQHEELITSAKKSGLKLIEPNNYFVLGFQRK